MKTIAIEVCLCVGIALAMGCGSSGQSAAAPVVSPFIGADLSLEPGVRLDGPDAYKTKLLRVTWKDGDTFRTVLVSIYCNGIGAPVWDFSGAMHPARDVFVMRSVDGGETWSAPNNISQTALLTSIDADHDGDPVTAPLPYAGDSGKATVFAQGKNVSASWEDAYVPSGAQGSAVYPEFGLLEVPYRAIYIARSKDAGATWTVQRMTGAERDAKQSVCRGTSAGWAFTWQEDPEGLQPGQAEGPGEGGSGAKVSQKTDIWYTRQEAAEFGAMAPLPAPIAVTDNAATNQGASRCNMFMFGTAAVIAYEETKGTEGVDEGKYVRYHVFTNFLDPLGSDASMGQGFILSMPYENARRVRMCMLPGGAVGPGYGTKIMFLWKQGNYDQGGPSDIMARIGHADGSHAGPSDGTWPDQLMPPLAPGGTTPVVAAGNAPPLNLSSSLGLTADSEANAFEDARAHRGIIRGDTIFMGYCYTTDWAVARYTDLENYNFYMRKSLDGGATWSPPFNISQLTNTAISVREPRIVGTPKSTDPANPQDPNVAYVVWGTEQNQYEHRSVGVMDLDIYLTCTLDLGETYSPIVTLAGGDGAQSESQLRTTPDGLTVWAVCNDTDPVSGDVEAWFRRSTP